jgi:hypothetical protein
LHPEENFLSVWDVFMLGIIGYSCFTSAFFLGYHMTKDYVLLRIEDATYICFALDIVFNFFRIYKDRDGTEVRSHSSIAKHYAGRLDSANLFIELISTFPFYLLPDAKFNLKLVRLLRLTRIIKIFDMARFLKIGDNLTANSSRMGKITMKISCKNVYAIFRMIIVFIIVTYFIACLFFYLSKNWNSEADVLSKNTFVIKYGFDKEEWLVYLLSISYYISTTVNIIGYGEMSPQSNSEKVFICFVMFIGQLIAVTFMG